LIPSTSSGQALCGQDGRPPGLSWRSRPTRVIGRRFFIYAPLRQLRAGARGGGDQGRLVARPDDDSLAPWIELAGQVGMIEPGALALLPTGVIVGSAVVEKCVEPWSRGIKRKNPPEFTGGFSCCRERRSTAHVFTFQIELNRRSTTPGSAGSTGRC
jgi:hypothetical protein